LPVRDHHSTTYASDDTEELAPSPEDREVIALIDECLEALDRLHTVRFTITSGSG
jgi:hypothetical protein